MLKLIIFLMSFSTFAETSDFISEASGICRVGNKLIIAGDEEKKSLWIADENGANQKTEVKGVKWDDMEALSSIDSQSFFGMTSHSLTKSGKQKPERELLIQFSLKGNSITAEKTWSLRNTILKFLAAQDSIDMRSLTASPPQEGGLNMEGLAYHQGKIFLGLRSPLTKSGQAIMLEMNLNGSSPLVSGMKLLDLKGNGIRDLTPDGGSLLVLAGSKDDNHEQFALYRMNTTGPVSRVHLQGFSELLRPEGILKNADGSLTVVQDFVTEENQNFFVRLNHL